MAPLIPKFFDALGHSWFERRIGRAVVDDDDCIGRPGLSLKRLENLPEDSFISQSVDVG
jgi:hypothetical protein